MPKDLDSSQPVEVTPGEGKPYVVEFSFEAQNAGELSVSEGDLVSVLRHSDSSGNPEWWLIRYNNATGYVPQSYLSPVGESYSDEEFEDNVIHDQDDDDKIGTTQDTNGSTDDVQESSHTSTQHSAVAKLYYCAEYAFEASSAAELSLDEGQSVVVIQKQDLTGNDEWWLVECNGHKGYVPSSYLTPVED